VTGTGRFPETVLRSRRLVLRPFEAGDAEDIAAGCSDELTLRWLPLPRPYTLEHAKEWCTVTARGLRESGTGIHFAITDAGSGRLLGTVGLNATCWRSLVTEVGYWMGPWARGRGIATEATRLLAGWALADQGFARVELRAATGTPASQRVAVKAGLRREGVLRNAGLTYDGRVDHVLFSLVPGDLTGV
jgi:RimJ/RimL family protein N-acetyltransferase